MTRQFPDPGPEEKEIEDTQSPVGRIRIPVPELERRKSHIDLITPNHPLLPLALRCLSYWDCDRPTAQELCYHLETMKRGPQYRQSHTRGQATQVHQAEELLQRLQDKDAVIAACHERERQHMQGIQQLQQELMERDQQLREQVERYQRETCRLLQDRDHAPEAKETQLQELSQQLQANEAAVADQQPVYELVQREKETNECRKDISPTNRKIVVEEVPRQQQNASAKPVDTIKLKWRTGRKGPIVMRGSAVVSSDGSKVYFTWLDSVYEYNTRGSHWSQLPRCPRSNAGLAVVEGWLTAVGGDQNIVLVTNDLFCLTQKQGEYRWIKHYPPMPTKRRSPAVVCSGSSLVVAGGWTGTLNRSAPVEVMDTSSTQWFTATSLPHIFWDASATLCGDRLYLMGGLHGGIDDSSLSVFTCSMTALLKSCHAQSVRAKMKALFKSSSVWKCAASVPVYFTSCSTLCGRVLAIGGNRRPSKDDPDPTDNVYEYDPAKNIWTVISHMPTPRYLCLVAALPDNGVLVVGGKTDNISEFYSDVVEIGSVE